MKRKAIETVPILERTLQPTDEEFTAFSQILDTDSTQILIVDLYRTRHFYHKETAPIIPYKRYVTDKKDFETYYPDKDKLWTKASLVPEWITPTMHFPKGAASAINTFLPSHPWRDSPECRLEQNESQIKRKKADKREEYHQNTINRRIALAGPLPKDADKWMKSLFKSEHYIFYNTQTQTKATGTCSACRSIITYDRRLEKPVHNSPCKCPECGKRGLYLAKGRKSVIESIKKAIIMQKTPQGFLSRFYRLRYVASPVGERLQVTEIARATWDGKKVHEDYACHDGHGEIIRWTDSNQNVVSVDTGYVYTKNLQEVFAGTPYKYCPMAELQEHTPGPIQHESMLHRFQSRPHLEQFIKMGLYHLTNEYLEYPWTDCIISDERDPIKALQLTRDRIKYLAGINGGLKDLRRLQLEQQIHRRLSKEEVTTITTYKVDPEDLMKILPYTGPTRFLRYLKRQLGPINPQWPNDRAEAFIRLWLDYLDMQQNVGVKIRLFPSDLKTEHDRMVKLIRVIEDAKQEERYQALKPGLMEQYTFQTKTLMTVIPESLNAIVKEGNDLDHCVARYTDRVARGETCILFLRKISDPDTAYRTMEVKDARIVQCQGYNNQETQTSEIKRFMSAFEKNLKKCAKKQEKERIRQRAKEYQEQPQAEARQQAPRLQAAM